HGHGQVGAVAAAVRRREGEAEVAGGVGPAAHLGQQRLPLLAREAAAVPVGPGVLPAVVEEADVVVLFLARLDLLGDEVVELGEVGDDVGRQFEVHTFSPLRRAWGWPRPAGRPPTTTGRGTARPPGRRTHPGGWPPTAPPGRRPRGRPAPGGSAPRHRARPPAGG